MKIIFDRNFVVLKKEFPKKYKSFFTSTGRLNDFGKMAMELLKHKEKIKDLEKTIDDLKRRIQLPYK